MTEEVETPSVSDGSTTLLEIEVIEFRPDSGSSAVRLLFGIEEVESLAEVMGSRFFFRAEDVDVLADSTDCSPSFSVFGAGKRKVFGAKSSYSDTDSTVAAVSSVNF